MSCPIVTADTPGAIRLQACGRVNHGNQVDARIGMEGQIQWVIDQGLYLLPLVLRKDEVDFFTSHSLTDSFDFMRSKGAKQRHLEELEQAIAAPDGTVLLIPSARIKHCSAVVVVLTGGWRGGVVPGLFEERNLLDLRIRTTPTPDDACTPVHGLTRPVKILREISDAHVKSWASRMGIPAAKAWNSFTISQGTFGFFKMDHYILPTAAVVKEVAEPAAAAPRKARERLDDLEAEHLGEISTDATLVRLDNLERKLFQRTFTDTPHERLERLEGF